MVKISLKILLLVLLFASIVCDNSDDNGNGEDYMQLMRDFVQSISGYANWLNPEFAIIPQNGIELVAEYGDETDAPANDYLEAIDGVGQEDLLYGYDNDNVTTPVSVRNYLMTFLDIAEDNGVEVLATNYCWDEDKMDDSYSECYTKGYISFAAPERALNVIPDYPEPVYNENTDNIQTLSDARNFLYLLNPEGYENKEDFLDALQATNYDLFIMDAFFEDTAGELQWYEPEDINSLKTKHDGGDRLVISYMSIGEAESYRYYWQDSWDADHDGHPDTGAPDWLADENPDWEGNYKVRYWDPGWQAIITGNDTSYLKHIIDLGFDGVYLDIIDAFEYFED